MKRDMDLIRSVLLELERQTPDLTDGNFGFDHAATAAHLDTSLEQLGQHLNLLYQAGFVEGWVSRGKIAAHSSERRQVDHDYIVHVMPRGLTWRGYEYLETIRDPEIWKKTKSGALKIGSFGVDTIKALALGFIKQKIKQHTGLDIEDEPKGYEA